MADENAPTKHVETPPSNGTQTDDVITYDLSAAGPRRSFIKLGVASLAGAGLGTAVFGFEFLSPNVLYEASPVVNVGKPEWYAPGSVTLHPDTGVYVMHGVQGFYALGAVCTHLGCLTVWNPERKIIVCPCHGSKFSVDGKKIEGPAPHPLPWLKVWLSEDGDLMVDRSTTLAAQQFVRV
jgi:nitrite reductase/ring-hydroxylating ferredoxin subunit